MIESQVIWHPLFKETLSDIRKANITITQVSQAHKFDFSSAPFPQMGNVVAIEPLGAHDLDAKNGMQVAKAYLFSAYDESKMKYEALEGSAFFTSHAITMAAAGDYLPVAQLSLHFYTKSRVISSESSHLTYSEDLVADSTLDYVTERNSFLLEWSPENSLLFIDGPLIGGNYSSYTVSLVESLHKKQIIPIFFVKNSGSTLVTTYIPGLNGQFNSDMHWSYKFLKRGQRTSFFSYVDGHNSKNAKAFCYLKAFDLSPQRIEIHLNTYLGFRDRINDLMDLAYYLILVQGSYKNPQIRPIAVSEMYAREVLRFSNSYQLIKASGLTPVLNQERFGG